MRTSTVILTAGALALAASSALAGHAAYSNFGNFASSLGEIAQASAVTMGNAPMIEPFVSNTASMRVVLDEAASVNTVRVLTPTLFVRDLRGTSSHTGLGADEVGDLSTRGTLGTTSADLSGLAPLRVSIYASASDVESRTAHSSFDFTSGMMASTTWDLNSGFLALTFDLGPTIDLGAGEWFIEVAQIDPTSAQFFLALAAGEGMHLFNPNTLSLQGGNFQFALELGTTAIIPIPAAGSLGIAGLIALGARVRRRSL